VENKSVSQPKKGLPMMANQKITIDGKEHALADLSQEAKNQLLNLQATD
jgi:hypothetical protein